MVYPSDSSKPGPHEKSCCQDTTRTRPDLSLVFLTKCTFPSSLLFLTMGMQKTSTEFLMGCLQTGGFQMPDCWCEPSQHNNKVTTSVRGRVSDDSTESQDDGGNVPN